MSHFSVHTPNSAPAGSRKHLDAAQQRYGRVPNLYGTLAEAPIAVEAYDTLGSLLMRSSFTPSERHVAWFTVNAYHDCRYCMAAHTVLAMGEKVPKDVIETARAVQPYADPRLEALRVFTLDLVESRGWAAPEAVDRFLAAGFTRQNMLELVVLIAHKVVSNYSNHIAETPIDPAFEPHTWNPPLSDAA